MNRTENVQSKTIALKQLELPNGKEDNGHVIVGVSFLMLISLVKIILFF